MPGGPTACWRRQAASLGPFGRFRCEAGAAFVSNASMRRADSTARVKSNRCALPRISRRACAISQCRLRALIAGITGSSAPASISVGRRSVKCHRARVDERLRGRKEFRVQPVERRKRRTSDIANTHAVADASTGDASAADSHVGARDVGQAARVLVGVWRSSSDMSARLNPVADGRSTSAGGSTRAPESIPKRQPCSRRT
jgi:hypothetical protein